jgi:hypothetical protein
MEVAVLVSKKRRRRGDAPAVPLFGVLELA